MARDVRGRLGSLSMKVTHMIDRAPAPELSDTEGALGPDAPAVLAGDPAGPVVLPVDLAPDDSLASLAGRLDLGVSSYVAGPKHSFDVVVAQLPMLFDAVARHVADRDQFAYLQLPGRCLPLTEELVDQRLTDLDGRPRLRLLIVDDDGRLAENIALELWKPARRAYRSLSDDNDIRLSIPDVAPPMRGPAPTEGAVDVPIDVVYTWVDGADPAWRKLAGPYLDLESLDGDRYAQTDELRYSLRSVEVFAPWVNHVYVLSNCAPPAWFKPTERVSWVDHREVADAAILPIFNSCAIDTLLHHIPGLSEHFLYLNDDFMLWDSVVPATFFTWDDRTIARMATNSSLIYLQQLVEAGRAQPAQHSRVNAARLLQDRLGVFPTHVHGHVPYALRRSMMEQLEHDFPDQIAATRASRTRANSDVSFVAYLYHHYAYAQGKAVYAEAPRSYVTLQNYRRDSLRRGLRQAPFACFQESRGSTGDTAYQAFKRESLEKALPLRSSAEFVPTSGI